MSTPEQPDPVPNPYAEHQLDDDSAGALAALLFDSPVQQAADTSVSGPTSDTPEDPDSSKVHPPAGVGETSSSEQVPTDPDLERPPSIDRSVVEATGTLFEPLAEPGLDDLGPQRPPAGNRPLFDGQPPVDPDQPASLRWSTVVHEPTVAEMGQRQAGAGRRLFLEDAEPSAVPPRLYAAPPDRFGAGQSAFGELVERRWHWFAVAGVTALLIGFVAFTIGGGDDAQDRFPSVSAQSGDDGAESVADTVPGGPALAANEEGNAGSFKGATTETSTSTPAATAPRRTGGGTTTETSTSSSTSLESSTSSSSIPSSTTSTELSTTTSTTEATTTTTQSTTTSRPTTTTTVSTTTSTTADTTTTTADTTTTTDDTTTTTADTTTTTDDDTTTTADATSTTEATTTSLDDPGDDPAPSSSSSSTTSTTVADGQPGIVVVSDDPPSRSDITIF